MEGSTHARAHLAEFRRRAVAPIEAGQSVANPAADLSNAETILYHWIKQDRIDRGLIPGCTTTEYKELRRTKKRIRGFEAEIDTLR